MTNEEAQRVIYDMIRLGLLTPDENEALHMAYYALKERLSVKPIVKESGRITAYKCPRCGNIVAYSVGERLRFSTWFKNYTCSCGQVIDLSGAKTAGGESNNV